MRPSIALQLKATINLGRTAEGLFKFPLPRRNYDLLRIATQVPRLLVVLDLPRQETDWLSVTAEELVLRRCAYWCSWAGLAESDNKESVTVSIPASNRLDVPGLQALMEQSRRGTIA